jgi:hypothetical protein
MPTNFAVRQVVNTPTVTHSAAIAVFIAFINQFPLVLDAIERFSLERNTLMLRGLAKINRQEIRKTDPQDDRSPPPTCSD